jgi:hypothetical protein
MHILSAALIAFSLSANLAWADIVSTWKLSDGAVSKLSVRDDRHVRIDTDEKDTYMLLSDQKVYMVRKEKGQWTAFDMDQMFGMMPGLKMGTASPAPPDYRQQFRDTGRRETIAGYKGKVFEVTYTGPDGNTQKNEIVLSSHPDVETVHRGWIVFAARMSQMLGNDSADKLDQSLKAALNEERGGMLRFGNDITLQSVEKPSLNLSHYQLPPGVQMVDMASMGAMSGGPSSQPARNETAGGGQESQARQKNEQDFATDTAGKAADAAKDQTQQSIVEGVREGVKGMFKKVW